MIKILEAFSAWFGIPITGQKKSIGLRECKAPVSDQNLKILVWLKHIFYPNIYASESLSLY